MIKMRCGERVLWVFTDEKQTEQNRNKSADHLIEIVHCFLILIMIKLNMSPHYHKNPSLINNVLTCGQVDIIFIALSNLKETPAQSCVNIVENCR